MDFKNMLQKNVGNLKNKIPPIPNMPKLPKLKSRKIFNRSNENDLKNDNKFANSQLSIGSSYLQPPQLSESSIVNRSPSRISTISSLVEGGQHINYNISESVGQGRNRRRIRFDDNTGSNDQPQKSNICFTERLTKHYKELSEFKFSHIFGKKTIVRTTEIKVDMYKQSFDEQNSELANERRMSRDYEFEFRSLPAIGNNGADEPHTPTAPNVQSILRTPSTSFGFQQEITPTIQTTNFNEITNDTRSTTPPLSRRKTFSPNDESSTPPESQKKPAWKIRSLKKKSADHNNHDDEIEKDSNKSKPTEKSSGMWQIRRPIKTSGKQDSVENPDGTDNLKNPDNFKKSLNNIFKKLPSLSSFDDPSDDNTKSPKKSGMWKIQRPIRVKVSTEHIPSDSNTSTDSDFMKQFNKIVGKSSKLKTFINKEPTHSTTENENQENQIEDTSKGKSLEEIESFGYGRKNLKFINMWKVRRRREIRRNDPFPINRTNDQDQDLSKKPGMWQLRRPVRIKTVINEGEPINGSFNPQLAEITKSLMNLFKRNQSSVEQTSTEDENNQIEIENKPGFWKKISQKKKDTINVDNELDNDENIVEKLTILDKAKKQISSRMNLTQSKSLELEEPQQELEQNKIHKNPNDITKSMDSFESFESPDEETIEDLEKINRNLSWNRQINLSNAYLTDSDEEDIITTPGYFNNQPHSVKCEIEPTIIIVSKPMPSILQYESVIQRPRLYPSLSVVPPTTPPPSLPKTFTLELPLPVVFPTPPPPKRQFAPPCDTQQDQILSPPHSPTSSSQSPSPPLLPISLPPELSPPPKSLPPLPISLRPNSNVLPLTSTVPTLRPFFDKKSRYRHSRKPSIDSNDSDSWIPETSHNRNVLELNKIEETFEQWNSLNSPSNQDDETLKKWKSIDIFSGNDEVFDDFDDELKNEPVITIAENICELESVSGSWKFNSEHIQPTGVPVNLVKHKITKPLVKQGSLRRQFSEEKDAADLNKKRNVNKMITRFDPERASLRLSIRREHILTNTQPEIKPQELKSTLDEKPKLLIENLKASSSLEVEIDKNDFQSSSDDDSSDSITQEIPARPPTVLERKPAPIINNIINRKQSVKNSITVEKKLAPQPPSLPKTAPPTSKILNNEINQNHSPIDNIPIIKDKKTIINSVNDSNENIQKLIMKRNILQSRQQSEDNFYSLDYTDDDETTQKSPLDLDSMNLVKEEYSIEL